METWYEAELKKSVAYKNNVFLSANIINQFNIKREGQVESSKRPERQQMLESNIRPTDKSCRQQEN